MQLCVALAAACCQLAGAQGSLGTKWAVLVTGSHTYDNYRHHAVRSPGQPALALPVLMCTRGARGARACVVLCQARGLQFGLVMSSVIG